MVTKITTSVISNDAITTDKISGSVSLGVKIANVSIANSTYAVLDDTAVNVGGGYLVITGSGFASGAQVIIDTTTATSTTFVNTTTLRAEVPAKSAATYNLYVANPDGGTAIKVNGLTYSGVPTWVTGSTLANVTSNTAFTGSLSATGATSYANTTALPAGFNLVSANGYYYGTISVGSDTTYSFTVRATDAENQDSLRTFSLSANVLVPVEYLVAAGGGGGGAGANGGNGNGGGGCGGVLTGNNICIPGTQYTIIVGAGGSAPSSGSNSSFLNVIAYGGGKAGDYGSAGVGGPQYGGGGGGSRFNNPGGAAGQGYAGGANAHDFPSGRGGGGGGGGMASAGGDGSTAPNASAGFGGAGIYSSITGTNLAYGGGGGGMYGGPGNGGVGGGGNGNTSEGAGGSPGQENTGGGAGSVRSGGSGVVIIRYADSFAAATSTTGSPTITTFGGYRIYKFTGSGSITF